MTLSDWASVAEIVGAIATVATLIYLTIQIRQHNFQANEQLKLSEVDTTTSVVEAWSRLRAMLVVPENAELMARGLGSYQSLSRPDQLRFNAIMDEALFAASHMIQRHEYGYIGDQSIESQLQALTYSLKTPGGVEFWEARKSIYPDFLRQRLDIQ